MDGWRYPRASNVDVCVVCTGVDARHSPKDSTGRDRRPTPAGISTDILTHSRTGGIEVVRRRTDTGPILDLDQPVRGFWVRHRFLIRLELRGTLGELGGDVRRDPSLGHTTTPELQGLGDGCLRPDTIPRFHRMKNGNTGPRSTPETGREGGDGLTLTVPVWVSTVKLYRHMDRRPLHSPPHTLPTVVLCRPAVTLETAGKKMALGWFLDALGRHTATLRP